MADAHSSRRDLLPARRTSELFEFFHFPVAYTVGISRYPDGRIAEVFVDGEKVDTDTDIAMRDAAIVLSFALQHGATVAAIAPAMTRGSDERPLGTMGLLLERLVQVEREAF